ncbi:MAG TPA: secretion system protein E [Nanoarchaeota archaeon]|nr:secretion system protein E [Nanoarchaeota archaeon]
MLESIKKLRGALYLALKGIEKEEYPEFEIFKPKFIFLPTYKNLKEVDIRYPLLPPYAYARIKWDDNLKTLVYNVVEPKLSEEEKKLLEKIQNAMLEIIDVGLSKIKGSGEVAHYIENLVKKVIKELNLKLKKQTYLKILYYIFRDFVGLNEIEPLFHDPYIEDIGCDGVNIPIYVVHKRFGSMRTNIIFRDKERLKDFVIKLAERCGRYISYAEPLLDGTLPDGSRVQATLAEDVTTRGPTFSIRKFRKNPFSPVELMELNTLSAEMLAYLWLAIEHKCSLLICGGVATGKTTLLNALSLFIPPEAKIVSIEDTRELYLPHENWIPAVTRTGFGILTKEGGKYGEVTMFDLLKASFRQNPDYVIVGEIRGKEAYVMFQGMASGHSCFGTMHAGKVEDVIYRLETPPIELSPTLIETLDLLIFMVHAAEKGKAARRVKEIDELQSVDPKTGAARINRAFSWLPASDEFEKNAYLWILHKISRQIGLTPSELEKEMEIRKQILLWMSRKGIKKYDEVSKIISEYYKNPEDVIKKAGIKI